MPMKKKPATAHSSPAKGHHQQHQHTLSRGSRPSTMSNGLGLGCGAMPALPSLVSNAMTSTAGWTKEETEHLLELEYKEEIFQYMKQMEVM